MLSSSLRTTHGRAVAITGDLPQCMMGYTPPGVSLETAHGQTTQLPPWVWAGDPPGDLQGMLGYYLRGMLGYYEQGMMMIK